MKLEESGIYTIPMPAKIEMKTSKKEKSIIIEINGIAFRYDTSMKQAHQNEIELYEAIFKKNHVLIVSYEDSYDRVIGEKLYYIYYDKNLNWIQLTRSKVS